MAQRLGKDEGEAPTNSPPAPLSRLIGQSRYIVLLAVLAVILVALSLFVLGAVQAIVAVWHAWSALFGAQLDSTNLTVEFLEIVSVMLKAVVFYIIGLGLYSLFITPLNLTAALGVQTLNDLESKVVSVVIVIMAVTFLEHFIRWEKPDEILLYAGALALVVVPMVAFQIHSHMVKRDEQPVDANQQTRAQDELFNKDHDEQTVDGNVPAAQASE